jgi:hypothetical protein
MVSSRKEKMSGRKTKQRTQQWLNLWSVAAGILVFCLWTSSGHAEIYKYVKDGVVHYADKPPTQIAYTKFHDPSSTLITPAKTIIKKTTSTKTIPYLSIISKVAKVYEINPELIKAVIKVESNYNARAVSPKGARGLMQLMPATAKRFGVTDSFDPEENITGGVKYLRFLCNEFGEQNLELVLAGYNAGEEAVRKYDNTIPPYKETQQYVKRVLSLYRPTSPYRTVSASGTKIYRYVSKDGVVTFTNVPKVR